MAGIKAKLMTRSFLPLQGAIKLAQKFSIQPNDTLKLSYFAEILYTYFHMPLVLEHKFLA